MKADVGGWRRLMCRPLGRESPVARYNGDILASSGTQSKASGEPQVGAPGGAAALGARQPFYLLGAAPDFFLLGPGLTVVVSAVLGGLVLVDRLELATSLAFALTLLFVGPHYAATYRRAFASKEILRAHPIVTLVMPVLLAISAAAAVKWPASVGLVFFATYVVWSGYHYSGQSLGLAMLYPLRQGARLTPSEKRLVALPLYASWLLSLLGLFRLEVALRNPAYELTREALFRAPLPGWALAVAAAAVALSLSSVALLAHRRRRRGTPLPGSVWSVVLTQVAWFSLGLWNPFFNVVLVPIFHGAQYLAITSWHQTRGRTAAAFAVYAFSVLLLGLAINPGLMLLGRMLAEVGAGAGALRGHDAGARTAVLAAAVLSFINLHHFLMDGRIWRLRDRKLAASFGAPTAPGRTPAAP